MHGFTSYRQELMHVRIVQELLKNRIASVRFDFNGPGESDGMFEDMSVMNEVEDAVEILRYAKNLDFVGGADQRNFKDLVKLYTEDVVFRAFDNGKHIGDTNGRDAIEAAFDSFAKQFLTLYHMNGEKLFDVDG